MLRIYGINLKSRTLKQLLTLYNIQNIVETFILMQNEKQRVFPITNTLRDIS
jgi:hypothetical protein